MCVKNLVFFKDTFEENPEINSGLLLDDENIICLCCGSIIEKGDYTIIKKYPSFETYYANIALLENFSDELTEN